jgi:hypothetical protein
MTDVFNLFFLALFGAVAVGTVTIILAKGSGGSKLGAGAFAALGTFLAIIAIGKFALWL